MSESLDGDDAAGVDPLYQAMTRPAMRWGVSLEWLMLNALVTSFGFLWFKNLYVLPMALPIHLVGIVVARSDPHFFAVWRVRMQKCRPPRSSAIFRALGRRVYDP